MVTVVNPVQPKKAPCPIDVNEEGAEKLTDVKPVHPWKV